MSIGLKRNSFHEVIRNLVAFFLSLSSDLWESVKNEMGYRIKLPTSRPPRQGTLSIMTPLPSSSLGACQTQGIYGCHVRWVACRSSVSRWDLETIIEQKIKEKKHIWLVVLPSWKILVNGKDDIPYMKWKIKNVWNHQPDSNNMQKYAITQ